MSKSLVASLRRKLTQAEQLGQTDRAKTLQARLDAETAVESDDLSKLKKPDLVELATERGVDVDKKTKAEIVEALTPEPED